MGVDIPKLIIHHAYLAGEYKQRKHKKGQKMTLTNLRKKDTTRTLINYRVPLWDRCVPGKREPAFDGLADLQNPPHKRHGFRIFGHNPEVPSSNLSPATMSQP
jgi:hypothetical protein